MATIDDFEAEQVSQNYEPEPGQMATRTFWIAYAPYVTSYGHMEDRIARAIGTGESREEALVKAVRNTPDHPA